MQQQWSVGMHLWSPTKILTQSATLYFGRQTQHLSSSTQEKGYSSHFLGLGLNSKEERSLALASEIASMLGYPSSITGLDSLSSLIPFTMYNTMILHLQQLLQEADANDVTTKEETPTLSQVLTTNPVAVQPLPTEQDWINATKLDHDLSKCISILQQPTMDRAIPADATFLDKWFPQLIRQHRLETSQGILYLLEFDDRKPHLNGIHVCVVPHNLCHRVFAAYHASPSNGHANWKTTYWKIRLWFYWPGMSLDVK